MGGGKSNCISLLEAFQLIESISGKPMKYQYTEKTREGDHIVYYSDLRKLQAHYPAWSITRDINAIFNEIYEGWIER